MSIVCSSAVLFFAEAPEIYHIMFIIIIVLIWQNRMPEANLRSRLPSFQKIDPVEILIIGSNMLYSIYFT